VACRVFAENSDGKPLVSSGDVAREVAPDAARFTAPLDRRAGWSKMGGVVEDVLARRPGRRCATENPLMRGGSVKHFPKTLSVAARSHAWQAGDRGLGLAAWRRLRLAPPLLALACIASGPAHAALGQDAASVEADRVQAHATTRTVAHAAFTVLELGTESKGIVREYLSPSGKVFAISWHGPAKPDLRLLLGAHFDTLAAAPRSRSSTHGHMSVTSGNLVFESMGRMRSFHGRAYLIDAIPPGASEHDVE